MLFSFGNKKDLCFVQAAFAASDGLLTQSWDWQDNTEKPPEQNTGLSARHRFGCVFSG
jgi:hypothetical protein